MVDWILNLFCFWQVDQTNFLNKKNFMRHFLKTITLKTYVLTTSSVWVNSHLAVTRNQTTITHHKPPHKAFNCVICYHFYESPLDHQSVPMIASLSMFTEQISPTCLLSRLLSSLTPLLGTRTFFLWLARALPQIWKPAHAKSFWFPKLTPTEVGGRRVSE